MGDVVSFPFSKVMVTLCFFMTPVLSYVCNRERILSRFTSAIIGANRGPLSRPKIA
jgi:hypothetical protein